MPAYLLDTNILMRSVDVPSPARTQTLQAITSLVHSGQRVCITAQNVVEFWAVATRAASANGLGWNSADTAEEVELFRQRFSYLEETPAIFTHWLRLVSTYGITGRRAHDARLVAVMLAHSITHILTFNVADFAMYSEITVVRTRLRSLI